jgi:hypothetical protein
MDDGSARQIEGHNFLARTLWQKSADSPSDRILFKVVIVKMDEVHFADRHTRRSRT